MQAALMFVQLWEFLFVLQFQVFCSEENEGHICQCHYHYRIHAATCLGVIMHLTSLESSLALIFTLM